MAMSLPQGERKIRHAKADRHVQTQEEGNAAPYLPLPLPLPLPLSGDARQND